MVCRSSKMRRKLCPIFGVPLSLVAPLACGSGVSSSREVQASSGPATFLCSADSRDYSTSASTRTSGISPRASTRQRLPYQADWPNGMDGWTGSEGWHVVGGMLVNDGAGNNHLISVTAPLTLDYGQRLPHGPACHDCSWPRWVDDWDAAAHSSADAGWSLLLWSSEEGREIGRATSTPLSAFVRRLSMPDCHLSRDAF